MESVADRSLKSCNIRQLVFASHDAQLVSGFRRAVEGCGVEVMSLTDVGLPEPSGSARDPLRNATRKAAIVAAITNAPAIGLARDFHIDPLARNCSTPGLGFGQAAQSSQRRYGSASGPHQGGLR